MHAGSYVQALRFRVKGASEAWVKVKVRVRGRVLRNLGSKELRLG